MQLKNDSQIKAYKLPTDKNQAEISTTTPNLYLKVVKGKKAVTKTFLYIHYENNKKKRITLGQYPTLTLGEAIKKSLDLKSKRQKGEALKSPKIELLTFGDIATAFLDFKKSELKPKSLQDKKGRIEKYLFPSLKDKKITELKRFELLQTIQKRQDYEFSHDLGTETSRKTFGILKEIMNFAVNRGYIEFSPIGGIEFKDIFRNIKTNNHFRAITDTTRLSEFIKALYNDTTLNLITKNALKFALHTALRSSNVRGLKWEFIDFDKNLITIPRHLMKVKSKDNDFKLPLTRQTKEILRDMQTIQRGEFVFYSNIAKSKQLSENTLNQGIKRLGFGDELHFHGLRKIFSTITHENNFNSLIIEIMLDHTDTNKIRAIYNKSEHLKERAELMQWYSDYLDNLAK
ncbi:tyrosine-type recombinase/integrase [Campylobacter sp. JMF_08 NE1]|uniref:tyrosine-type recombinase/integrase n=1 Tax=Campylobacter sp. JMF_08 NE1 TaxID=2983821 RepID=UPI0022E9DE0D|nr:site-specific integrase [Campylobacter sp. JMF_08 NE1]MDA3047500.1 site-specific integrase [Campylobacter sp. JMF_08 NE1]